MVVVAEVEERREISEEELQQVRSRATELLLREDWNEYIRLYSHFISLFHHHLIPTTTKNNSKLHRFLCLALSSRAEARHRLGDLRGALRDCDNALHLDPTHRRALLCKAKVSLDLDRYSAAATCLQSTLECGGSSSDEVRSLLQRCRRLEVQSRTGAVDISDWILSGLKGEAPELAEYVGPVEIRRSKQHGGRGLFATRPVEAGTTLFVEKAAVIGRGVLPDQEDNGNGGGRLVMWRDVVDRLLDAAAKCPRTLNLLYSLSTGVEEEEKEGNMAIPEMGIFQPEWEPDHEDGVRSPTRPDAERILKILDLNSVREEEGGSVVGRGEGLGFFSGVGLWVLLSFMNHSCEPNAKRVHVGNKVVVHASRDVGEGEELTVAYFDVLRPWRRRREEGVRRWGFECRCKRCAFEAGRWGEMSGLVEEMEKRLLLGWKKKKEEEEEKGGDDEVGELVVRVEEGVGRRWKEEKRWRGWMRASLWEAYEAVYRSERGMRRWGRRVPGEVVVGKSVVGVVGGDERVLRVVVEMMMRRRRRRGGRSNGSGDDGGEERVLRMGKGVYGKVVRKRQAMKALIQGLVIKQQQSFL